MHGARDIHGTNQTATDLCLQGFTALAFCLPGEETVNKSSISFTGSVNDHRKPGGIPYLQKLFLLHFKVRNKKTKSFD